MDVLEQFLKEVQTLDDKEYERQKKVVEDTKCVPELEGARKILLGSMEAVRKCGK